MFLDVIYGYTYIRRFQPVLNHHQVSVNTYSNNYYFQYVPEELISMAERYEVMKEKKDKERGSFGGGRGGGGRGGGRFGGGGGRRW